MYLKKLSVCSCGISLLLLAFSFSLDIVWAQEPGDTIWTNTYGMPIGGARAKGYSVQQTIDEGYIVAGLTSLYVSYGSVVYLIKTDSMGDTLWTNTYSETPHPFNGAYSVQQTTDEGYIIAGGTGWMDDTDDVYLIKTDSIGGTLWTNTYGGATCGDKGYSVQQTSDEGYIVAGLTYSSGSGDVYLIKTDSIGDILWTKTYGGGAYDQGNSVKQTTDGGYIVVGYTNSFGAGYQDVYLIKTDSMGDTLWTKTYGGTGRDYGNSVQQTSDEGFIITGSTDSFGTGDEYVYLIKTDSVGDTLWTKIYREPTWYSEGRSVQQTIDGGYIVAGWTGYQIPHGGSVYLIKTDSFGDTLWTKTYGGTTYDMGNSVQLTSDGNYIVAGWKGYDVYLLKIAGESVSVGSTPQIPRVFALRQNYPNPFNPITTISYSIPKSGKVSLKIYNIKGQKVKTLVNEKLDAGTHQVIWDGKDESNYPVSSSIYFYEMNCGDYTSVKKMILMK